MRWPIRVFALDPVVTEQNVADVRSIYRQMQMAIALAFANGDVGVSAALQAMRKLQRDRATVDLNRVAVGFGHGDDTFGWKFYPRFQTPRVESNVTVLFRDLVIGGPTDRQLECSEEIEPGMRECVAIVLMPSFVPHVTFTTRGNWFKLGCPSHTAASIEDTVQYSRAIKHMQSCAYECSQCAHLYRDGELERLLTRVHQLDRKLPLQTMECQVPIENTLGGFEIFSAGTRELAPELTGWYGAPGYDRTRDCRLFLAGDNFNVTHSRLIIGNQEIPFRLLSRQIMEVTLPAGLAAMRDRKLDEADAETYDGYLDAHVATPYGVSGHLLIPVVRGTGTAGARPVMQASVLRIRAIDSRTAADQPYTVESFVLPASLKFLRIDVPRDVGLDVPLTHRVRVMTWSGQDRLVNVDIASLPRTADGHGYELTTTEVARQFERANITGGNQLTVLGGAFKHHLDYLLAAQINPGLVTYQSSAVLMDSSGSNPLAVVEGEVVFEVVLEKKSGAP